MSIRLIPILVAVLLVPGAGAETINLSSEADSAIVENLIGEIRVEAHGGPGFELEVTIDGRDASRDLVRVESKGGSTERWTIVFPTDEHRRYVYPALKGGKTRFGNDGDGWLDRLFGGRDITVSGRGSGLEVWADVVVRVPRGGALEVRHGVGVIVASDIDGELELAVRSGGIEADGIEGDLVADTGSGSIRVTDLRGNLVADTGSGSVEVSDCFSDRVSVDTGSGRVVLENVETDSLSVDTGSGRVEAEAIRAESASIDTGSGSVTLFLDAMGPGRFAIDTGSGSVTLGLPSPASARIWADTGSGGIDIDLNDYDLVRSDRDEAELVVGGGAARVELDTGSGSIRIRESG